MKGRTNAGGGAGKSNGANAWRRLLTKPAATATISPKSISQNSTGNTMTIVLKTSNSKYPVSDVTAEQLVGLTVKGRASSDKKYMHVQLAANNTVKAGYQEVSGSVTFSYTGSYTYDPSTGTVTAVCGSFDKASYSAVTNVTVSRDEIPLDYIVDDDPTAYVSGAFNDDGYYYELIGQISSANVMSLTNDALETVQQDYRNQIETEVSNA